MTAITADSFEYLGKSATMRAMWDTACDFFAGRNSDATAEHINGPAHAHLPHSPMHEEVCIPSYRSSTAAAEEKADKEYRGWLDMRRVQNALEKLGTELRHLMRIGVIGKKSYAAALHHPRAPRRPEVDPLYAHHLEEQIPQNKL